MNTAVVFASATLASAQTPNGMEFRVNTYSYNSQNGGRAAMELDGDFVVVWTSKNQDGSDYGVFGQRYDADGARRGVEFQVNTKTFGIQEKPAVAIGDAGDFIVVWQHQDPVIYNVFARRFSASGAPIGAEFRVNTFTTGWQDHSAVGMASDGSFVVAWTSGFLDGSGYAIAARRFDASGNPVGDEFIVNEYTTGDQTYPEMAVDPGGAFVIVWHSPHDGSDTGIFGRRYDASGTPQASEFQVNSYTTGYQSVASAGAWAGGFVVVWTGRTATDFYDVSGRRFDTAGNPVGDEFVVNTYTTGIQNSGRDSVAVDRAGNFAVSWTSFVVSGNSTDAFARRFDSAGRPVGYEFQVNTFTTAAQNATSVAVNGHGRFVVVWDSFYQDYSNWGVFAQRFGGIIPSALVVDSSAGPASNGNGVFEPGETVDVSPAWRNFSGAAQSLGGVASRFTGPGTPGDPVYSVPDAFASYGVVAEGAVADCASTGDCFHVRVTVPVARPVRHWDAMLQEDITPAILGESKEWLLHVGATFDDVAVAGPFYRFVETIVHRGVSDGCGLTTFCPFDGTSRAQMAVFVLVAKEGAGYTPPACGVPVFLDVPASSPFCRWVEELARRGVVNGCGAGHYCPASPVTREEMAVFALRVLDPAFNPPACGAPMFADVPASSPFCRWIEELARRGVVAGCGAGNYCPAMPVSREQMAVFLAVTFSLTLYGP